jgi:peptidoglycan hydrolase CwlO-like protein
MTNPQQKPRRSIIDALRDKPEKTRKRILWVSVIFITIILFSLWILQLETNIANADLQNLPKPEIEGENFKNDINDIDELIKELKDISGKNFQELKNLNENLEELKSFVPEGEPER